MKFRFSITVDLKDPGFYDLDSEGWAIPDTADVSVSHERVANHILVAVVAWGGGLAPGDPFFPSNIRSVRVTNPRMDVNIKTNGN